MSAVLESDGQITYEEAVKNCDYPLLQSNWHELINWLLSSAKVYPFGDQF